MTVIESHLHRKVIIMTIWSVELGRRRMRRKRRKKSEGHPVGAKL
jgi:hypothetical protein